MKPIIKKALGLLKWIPDKQYLQLYYFVKFKKPLNLKNPKTYNEKLQWLKLYHRRPEYSRLVDKYEAKLIVEDVVGSEYIIPTLGVWDRVEDIDFHSLPNQFVLKCTHDCGGLVICKDKSQLNIEETKQILNTALRSNFYHIGREWPYKNVRPRILAEAYMEDTKTGELRDYKFYCFDGEPKVMLLASDRQTEGEESKFDFYDMGFEHLDFRRGHPNSDRPVKKPETFDAMRKLAEQLSQGLPHVRVDLYEVNGKNYFGELTFYPGNGMTRFEPEEWDYTLGDWITLPEKKQKGK